jgi:hypothetical protein
VAGNLRNVRDILGIRWTHRQIEPRHDLVSEVSEAVSRSDS